MSFRPVVFVLSSLLASSLLLHGADAGHAKSPPPATAHFNSEILSPKSRQQTGMHFIGSKGDFHPP